MKLALLIFAAILPLSAHAQDISGRAIAIDGDSLDMAGIGVRLHGIDAPEARQICRRSGEPWACGKDAAAKLATLVGAGEIRCLQRDVDRHGRIVATCTVGTIDLAAAMVEAGLAVALRDFSETYVAAEERARSMRIGIWGSEFQMPAEYRSSNPEARPRRTAPTVVERRSKELPRMNAIYYRNCAEAWAAGAAPLYRGRPGYRPEMDGDGDGIACEPYRGR